MALTETSTLERLQSATASFRELPSTTSSGVCSCDSEYSTEQMTSEWPRSIAPERTPRSLMTGL